MGVLDPPSYSKHQADALFPTIEEQINPRTGRGILARAENMTAQPSNVSAAGVAAGFCILDWEPCDRDVWLVWEIHFGIVTAPGVTYGGSLDGILWEMTMSGSTPVATEVDRDAKDVAAGRPIKTLFGKAHGELHIGPTTVLRQFALGAGLIKDNAAGTLVGQMKHQVTNRSFIQAEAK